MRRGPRIDFLRPAPIGEGFAATDRPLVANVAIADLDGDGLADIVVADAATNRVTWMRQAPAGTFTEQTLAEVPGPRTRPARRSRPRRRSRSGGGQPRRALPEQRADRRRRAARERRPRTVHPARRARERGARGRRARRRSRRRRRPRPVGGAVRLRPGRDALDEKQRRLALRQPDAPEALRAHQRRDRRRRRRRRSRHRDAGEPGVGGDLRLRQRRARRLHAAADLRRQQRGLRVELDPLADLDGDGDPDVVYSNGDAFDYATADRAELERPAVAREHAAALAFTYHRIGDFPGASSPQAADLDGDGDLDIAVVSAYNNWDQPGRAEPGVVRERRARPPSRCATWPARPRTWSRWRSGISTATAGRTWSPAACT